MKGILSVLLITLTALPGGNRAFSQGVTFTNEGGRLRQYLATNEFKP